MHTFTCTDWLINIDRPTGLPVFSKCMFYTVGLLHRPTVKQESRSTHMQRNVHLASVPSFGCPMLTSFEETHAVKQSDSSKCNVSIWQDGVFSFSKKLQNMANWTAQTGHFTSCKTILQSTHGGINSDQQVKSKDYNNHTYLTAWQKLCDATKPGLPDTWHVLWKTLEKCLAKISFFLNVT